MQKGTSRYIDTVYTNRCCLSFNNVQVLGDVKKKDMGIAVFLFGNQSSLFRDQEYYKYKVIQVEECLVIRLSEGINFYTFYDLL